MESEKILPFNLALQKKLHLHGAFGHPWELGETSVKY